MHRMTRGALLATACSPFVIAAAAAQDGARVSGTITLEQSRDGRVHVVTSRRARLGVSVSLVASPATDSVGAMILTVTPGGPAARAGLLSGDIVLRFNGKPVLEQKGDIRPQQGDVSAPGIRLIELASTLSPGDSAVLQYRRGPTLRSTTLVAGDDPMANPPRSGNMVYNWQTPGLTTIPPEGMTYSYLLRESPRVVADSGMRVPMGTRLRPLMPSMLMMESPLANLELAPINPELGRYFGTTGGVLVIDAPQDSKLGLKPGDVVLTIDGREVRDPRQLLRAMQSYDPGETFTLQLMRQKARVVVTGSIAMPTP